MFNIRLGDFLKHVHLSTLGCYSNRGLLEGHHTLSELRSLNEKETEKINKKRREGERERKIEIYREKKSKRGGGSVSRWSGKDKGVDAAH